MAFRSAYETATLLDLLASMTRRARSSTGSPTSSPERNTTSEADKQAPSAEDVQGLTTAVDALAHQVHRLMLVMDEIREDLVHAVRNDVLNPCRTRDQWRPVDHPTAEDEEVVNPAPREQVANPRESVMPTPPVSSPARSQQPLF